MDLKLNQAISITQEIYKGEYRVVAISDDEIFFGVIQSSFKGLRKRSVETVSLNNQSTSLLILKKKFVEKLIEDAQIDFIEISVTNAALQSIDPDLFKNPSITVRYHKSIDLMSSFLDLSLVSEKIIQDRNFSKLIGTAVKDNKCDPRCIYRRLQRLIKYGFTEVSLIPEFFKSGGPGQTRIYKKDSKICGAKPLIFKHAVINNKNPIDQRSVMKEDWKTSCDLAIDKYYKPGMSINATYNEAIKEFFTTKLTNDDGQLIAVKISEENKPSYDQFKYFLRKKLSKLERLKRLTTKHNFNQNHRALLGKSFDGVGGPGHTFAIDSTIADAYVVSTLNREIIVGRPIVYFLVCLYSGAIVGFYACLDGPKWDTAKIALFCTAYDSVKLSKLTGIPHFEVFRHQPGIPKVLLGDRGEYLSKKAIVTCLELDFDQEFTAPYRGDGKGDVEVQFKHIKDDQLPWVPGAHDARRIEMEKRKSHPLDATMTLHEFVIYVSTYVRKYNLTADMSGRLTDSMKAAKVKPTPAGIWDWGFDNGIGYSTHTSEDELIRNLLPKLTAKTSPNGINLDTRFYADPDEPLDNSLAVDARNFGESNINAWYYPGNIQHIWTDNGVKQGFRSVPRKHNDSRYISVEEYEDAQVEFKVYKSDLKHEKLEIAVRESIIRSEVIADSKAKSKNSKPTSTKNIKDNQKREIDLHHHNSTIYSSEEMVPYLESMLETTESASLNDIYQSAFDEVDQNA